MRNHKIISTHFFQATIRKDDLYGVPQNRKALYRAHQRIYDKVISEFDTTGSMVPLSITWADGRTFAIEAVRDYRPAGAVDRVEQTLRLGLDAPPMGPGAENEKVLTIPLGDI